MPTRSWLGVVIGLGASLSLVPPAHAEEPAAVVKRGAEEHAAGSTESADAALESGLEEATAAYCEALNGRHFETLAEQWTAGAELIEGGGRVAGRDAIMASIRGWVEANPESRLEIRLERVKVLSPTVARVGGVMGFTRKPGAKTVETRFESLRVHENGAWRLAESIVEPSQVEALEGLSWMVGTWKASDPRNGTSVEATYQRVAGGHLILGGVRYSSTDDAARDGGDVDVVELIHPDKTTGTVRSWVFDSTGARAEGVFETDGTVFNRRFVGTTADGATATVSRWVQLIVPTGEGKCTMQSIERSLDGEPLPDRPPLHFTRVK